MDTTTDHFTPLALRVRGNKVSGACKTYSLACYQDVLFFKPKSSNNKMHIVLLTQHFIQALLIPPDILTPPGVTQICLIGTVRDSQSPNTVILPYLPGH